VAHDAARGGGRGGDGFFFVELAPGGEAGLSLGIEGELPEGVEEVGGAVHAVLGIAQELPAVEEGGLGPVAGEGLAEFGQLDPAVIGAWLDAGGLAEADDGAVDRSFAKEVEELALRVIQHDISLPPESVADRGLEGGGGASGAGGMKR